MDFYQYPILCIEDDADTCDLIKFVFSQAGYTVEFCSQINCLKMIRKKRIAAVILDNYLGETKGTEICRQIRSFDQFVPIIFFSGEARRSEIDLALAAGADIYLVKPEGFEELVPAAVNLIRRAVSEHPQSYPMM